MDDVREASAAEAAAQKDWAMRNPEDRDAVVRRAGMLWEEHAAEVRDWIVRESVRVPPKAALETRTRTAGPLRAAVRPASYPSLHRSISR